MLPAHELPAGGSGRERSVTPKPCRIENWPDIPIQVLAGRDDRFFPIQSQRRIARERLAKEVDGIPGGHLVALSNPEGLTEWLLGCEKGRGTPVSCPCL